jgi:hypothetical protein
MRLSPVDVGCVSLIWDGLELLETVVCMLVIVCNTLVVVLSVLFVELRGLCL